MCPQKGLEYQKVERSRAKASVYWEVLVTLGREVGKSYRRAAVEREAQYRIIDDVGRRHMSGRRR